MEDHRTLRSSNGMPPDTHDPESEPVTIRQRGFLKANNLWNEQECYTKARATRIIREFVAQQQFSDGLGSI